jgi:isopenicillin N synthase-like dioxygenase
VILNVRVVLQHPDGSFSDIYVSKTTSLNQMQAKIQLLLRTPVASVYAAFVGPEHLTSDYQGYAIIRNDVEWRSVLADGVHIMVNTPPEEAVGVSMLPIPKISAVGALSFNPVFEAPHAWGGIHCPTTLDFFKKYGWVIIKTGGDLPKPPVSYFQASVYQKRLSPMAPDDRTWGWHHMTHLGKEIFKVRDVDSFRDGFSDVNVGSADEVLTAKNCIDNYYAPMQTLGLTIARSLLLGLGLKADAFDKAFVAGDRRPTAQEEPFTSFFEAFQYAGLPLSHTFHNSGSAGFIPCESHFDIGCITITTASSIGTGMQLKHRGQWIDAEKCLLEAGRDSHVLVFAGELMDYMTNSAVPKVEHRVVMATGSLPRYSTIFEVLPLPWEIVPFLPRSQDGGRYLGKDVFLSRSMGRTSVNWNVE